MALYQSPHASKIPLSIYFNIDEWLAVKKQALEDANYKCATCNKKATQVNHLTFMRLRQELPSDLQAVCKTHFNQLAKTI